jgi:hypothetical protein
VDTADCFLQGDAGTKVKVPGAGKKYGRRALQAPPMERLCKLHYFPLQGPCLIPNIVRLFELSDCLVYTVILGTCLLSDVKGGVPLL